MLGEHRRVPLEHEQVDPGERLLDPLGIKRLALRPEDLLRRGRLRALVGVEEVLVELLPGRAPTISIAMSRSGSSPDSRIIVSASSMIFTGSPISSTNTSPLRSLSDPARMISWTASGIVMK